MTSYEILKTITEDDILKVLADNGITPAKIRDNEFWFRTFCHGGDSDKLCYFRDTKQFRCYTNCGQMNFITVYSKLKHCTEEEAISDLEKKIRSLDPLEMFKRGPNYTSLKNFEEDRMEEMRLAGLPEYAFNTLSPKKIPENNKYTYNPENLIKNVFGRSIYSGWVKEGIDPRVADDFSIRSYEIEDYIIIPHYDTDGKIIGIRRRSLKPEDEKNKYMPLSFYGDTYGHPLGMNLYGIDINKHGSVDKKEAVVFEAEKSVLECNSFYADFNKPLFEEKEVKTRSGATKTIQLPGGRYKNCNFFATCGHSISQNQINMLQSMHIEYLYLAFDNDYDVRKYCGKTKNCTNEELKEFENYMEGMKRLCKKCSNFFKVKCIIDTEGLLGPKDSPSDKGKEVFEYLKNNAFLYDKRTNTFVKNKKTRTFAQTR